MNIKKILNTVIIIISIFIITSCSCKNNEIKPNYITLKQSYFGYLDTQSTVTVQFDSNVISKDEMVVKLNGVKEVLVNIERIFSPEQTYIMISNSISQSELMKVNTTCTLDNDNNPIYCEVSDSFIEVLKKSNEVSALLDGYFDVSVGPLTSLWDISNQMKYNYVDESLIKVPTSEQVLEAISFINYQNIIIDEENNKVAFNKKGMKLDFGAIAKGYACDKVFEYMKQIKGVTICLIDLGGNIYSFGQNEGVKTSMAIRNPFYSSITDPYTLLDSPCNDCSMVTSGIYERYIIKDGVTYHHLLDPITGYPFDNDIECVTIIGTSSMTCDALATGIYGLGLTEGISVIQSLPDYNAVFVTKDKKVYVVGDIEYTPTEGLVGFEFINIK